MFFQTFSQTEGLDKIKTIGLSLVNLLEVVIGVLVSLAFLFFFYSVLKFIATNDTTKKAKSFGNVIWGLVVIFILVSIWGIIAVSQSLTIGKNVFLSPDAFVSTVTDAANIQEEITDEINTKTGSETLISSNTLFECELSRIHEAIAGGFEDNFHNTGEFLLKQSGKVTGMGEGPGIERLIGKTISDACKGIGGEQNIIKQIFEYIDENIEPDQLSDLDNTLVSVITQGIQSGFVNFQVLAKQLVYSANTDKLEFTIATTRPMSGGADKPSEVRCISSEGGIISLEIIDDEEGYGFKNDNIRYDGRLDVDHLVDGEVYRDCSIDVKEDVGDSNRNPVVLSNIVLGSFRKGTGLPDIFSDNTPNCHTRVGLTSLTDDFENKVPSREILGSDVIYTFETQRIKGDDHFCTLDLINLSNSQNEIYIDGSPGEENSDRKVKFTSVFQKMMLNGYRLDKRDDYTHVIVGGGNLQTGKKEFQCGISQDKEVCAENLQAGISVNKTYERICSQVVGVTVDKEENSVEQTWLSDYWDYCVYREKSFNDREIMPNNSIQIVGQANLNNVGYVHIQGNYAYVTASVSNSLTVIDISDPDNPTRKGTIQDNINLDGAQNVYVQGNYAYVAVHNTDRLTVIDISDPNNPILIESISDSNLDAAWNIYIQGNHAYVVSRSANSLTVIDISDPTNPTLRGSIQDRTNLRFPNGIHVQENYAYVVAFDANSLTVIDISDPTNPTLRGLIKSDMYLKGPSDVYVRGDYAYVTAGNSLTIINISDPTNPTLRGSISDSNLDGAQTTYIQGNHAYVAAFKRGGLVAVDISNPNNPIIRSSINHTNLDGVQDVYVQGNYAYATSSRANRLVVMDISNIQNTFSLNDSVIETSEFNRLIDKLIIEDITKDELEEYLFDCIVIKQFQGRTISSMWNVCLREKGIN